MNHLSQLRRKLESADAPSIAGAWRPIRICLDEDAGEFLNMGVMFQYSGKVEVKMLDKFERLKCLYGNRFEKTYVQSLLLDVEKIIHESHLDLGDSIGDFIQLGPMLYASGANPESIVNEFYSDIVTLSKDTSNLASDNFRYRSSSKVRETVFDLMRERMMAKANWIIQTKPYHLQLSNHASIDLEVPLLSTKAAGSIVSAWYKSPIVVQNNLLQASSDLLLIKTNTDISKLSMSVLIPPTDSGMDKLEYAKHKDVISRQLEKIDMSGIEIVGADATDILASKTIEWWSTAA